jgi:hypothetical protein
MGSSAGPRLGSAVDHSRFRRAALAARDQSATDPKSQARRPATRRLEACRCSAASQIVRWGNEQIYVIAQPSLHREDRACATANAVLI